VSSLTSLKAETQTRHLLSSPEYQHYWYAGHPVEFVHDLIDFDGGAGPAGYQDEILAQFGKSKKARVAVRGPHGLGKTTLSAWVVLWFVMTRDQEDWKAITTAGAWAQLKYYLWPEIHKWASRIRWDKIKWRGEFVDGYELLRQSIQLKNGRAFAVASDRPTLIEGAHARHMVYVFDESKSVMDATFDAAEGAFASPDTAEALAIAMSTPGASAGRFYDIHSRKPGYEDWWVRHVTIEEAIAAGRISVAWVEARKRQWGETSSVYKNHVLGEFAAQDESGVIPLAWVEAAQLAWVVWEQDGFKAKRCTGIGVDVGGGLATGDQSTIAVAYDGPKVRSLQHISQAVDPSVAMMELCGRVVATQDIHQGPVYVDVIGIGAGVAHRLVELKRDANPFNASWKTEALDRSQHHGFPNARSAAWWMMREILDPANGFDVCLPDDTALVYDLTAPQYSWSSGGQIMVESKQKLRKRIKRSPDAADAVIHAITGEYFWAERQRMAEEEKRQVYISYRPVKIR